MIHTSTETIFKGCVLKNMLSFLIWFMILLVTVLLPPNQRNCSKATNACVASFIDALTVMIYT